MRVILSILLLPFALVFILIGAIKGALGVKNLKYIPRIIQMLAEKRAPATAIAELKFPQVLAYAEEVGVITEKDSDSFVFIIKISGESYNVKVGRAPDGSNCAIFRCSRLEASPPSATVLSTGRVESFVDKKKSTGRHDVEFDLEDPNMQKILAALDQAYMNHSKNCPW